MRGHVEMSVLLSCMNLLPWQPEQMRLPDIGVSSWSQTNNMPFWQMGLDGCHSNPADLCRQEYLEHTHTHTHAPPK